MSNESIGVADQKRESMAQHLALAERELSAFVTAVHQLFGAASVAGGRLLDRGVRMGGLAE